MQSDEYVKAQLDKLGKYPENLKIKLMSDTEETHWLNINCYDQITTLTNFLENQI